MGKKIKAGIVSYLNTRPLIYGLQQPPLCDMLELVEDTPARLADRLLSGDLDLGLIPVATLAEMPEYHIAGDYCIGCEGEVASVCLFSEVPVEKIEKVYLDYQSRSSAALLKWLMREYWGISPQLVQTADDSFRNEIRGTAAGLVIGDRAFSQRKISTFIYDLGAEWKKITGLPFVFAAWISPRPLDPYFIDLFNEANAAGLQRLDEIVAAHPYDLYDLKRYYSFHISYKLDDKKREGMQLFLQYIHNYEAAL